MYPKHFCMQKWSVIFSLVFLFVFAGLQPVAAQCSICTKTAMQLGDKPATGLNSGVIYLALAPFAVVGYIGYRWWKNEKEFEEENNAPST